MSLFQTVIFLSLFTVFIASAAQAQAEVLDGRPVNILSGEDILLLDSGNNRYRVKLIGLNTEPPNRPWGSAARRHLSMLVAGKPVAVHIHHRDLRGNIVGRLVTGGLDINLRMLRDGLARHSPAHQSEQESTAYAAAERQAREAQLGLWKRGIKSRRIPVIQLPGSTLLRHQPD